MRDQLFLTLTLLPLAASLSAQELGSTCSGTTQLEANICARDRWQLADDKLNRLWREVKPRADARGAGQALLGEQRGWLRQRDAKCKPELNSKGSMAPSLYYGCMQDLTEQRNVQLRGMR